MKHVPPQEECIVVAAPWMHIPVKGSLPNNVARVRPMENGKFEITVGSQIIDVLVKVKIGSAQILEAELTDTFELVGRICSDKEGSSCEEPKYYQQKRTLRVVPL